METTQMSHHIKIAAMFFILHTVTCSPVKSADRPVHEIINEQARSDDVRLFLPYANPLAGNSLQNAKIHAQHQQAMFDAERKRQHRAQIMRWNQAPTKADSYMRAYHDLQETHQLELEKEQSTIYEKLISPVPPPVKQEIPKQKADIDNAKRNIDRGLKKPRNQRSRAIFEEMKLTTATAPPVRQQNPTGKPVRVAPKRQDNVNLRQSLKNTQVKKETLIDKHGPEITTFIADDDVVNRNHRSYGSLEYHKFIPNVHGTVQIAPAPAYDQGVYIKSRGNIGYATTYKPTYLPNKLYTNIFPSKTQYIYPKQYGQEYNRYINSNEYAHYLNAQNIGALQTLLQKRPQEQANELNTLVENYSTESQESISHPLVYHYVQNQPLYQNYQPAYGGNAINYANYNHNYQIPATSGEVTDHTPLNTAINNVLPKPEPIVPYVQQTITTQVPHIIQPEVTNHFNDQKQVLLSIPPTQVAVEQQNVKYFGDISTEQPRVTEYYKPEYKPVISHKPVIPHKPIIPHKPAIPQKPVVHFLDHNRYGEVSQSYYHHNNRPGVQHLNDDGVGVSAYGDEDLHYAANYEFGYRVKDVHAGNDFGHYENKNGRKTDGHYHVLLPDGRMQKVSYTAGPGGFHADISYDHLH
ncbi:hypothetical protein K1T71_013965 [Dendrolimus kikuchii]|uniref:Uncharacterized protein n=1 Tax=Dendrolimus kikuchii TaxID=765133 RepID=A0ACC1CG88_9NEOP|nr:hypothetical protein K1T71_013965 [Dendrolimus kikuchii]